MGIARIAARLLSADNGFEQVFRGEGGSSKKGGRYWSPDEAWAARFTQTGQASELLQAWIRTSDIHDAGTGGRPYAGDPDAIDEAVATARGDGFKAIRLDEGMNEPPSVFVFDRTALKHPGGRTAARKLPYFSNCVNWSERLLPALNLLIDEGEEIGRDGFLASADADADAVPDWDWHIRYFRYGDGIYWYVHSAIEHVFAEPESIRAVQDAAAESGY